MNYYFLSYKIRFRLLPAFKTFYRKLKYREKVLEEFQRVPQFPKKMVSYSSTKFGILKPWTTISNLLRFYLVFWQAPKPFCRKLKYMENNLEEFQRLRRFTRKMVLYSSTKFGVLKPLTIVSNLIRFDLGFCQPSKQTYRKLEYSEKLLKEFQRLLRFPRKMVLYSSTKFGILKPWTSISNLIRFDLGLRQPSNHFIGNSNMERTIWKSFNLCLGFPEKWFCIRQPILAF